MKLTPWFSNKYKPSRNGVYEIKGSILGGKNFRTWNGSRWSLTYGSAAAFSGYSEKFFPYNHGEDMTGWRGIEKG